MEIVLTYNFLIFIADQDELVSLVCIFDGDIQGVVSEKLNKFCEDRDEIIELLKDCGGVFYADDVLNHQYDDEEETTVYEYPLIIKNEVLLQVLKQLQTNKSTFNNKK